MTKHNYYSILIISPSATPAEITRAYRKLALKYHPDRNKDQSTTEIFGKISEAYNVLKDVEKRKKYDELNGYNKIEEPVKTEERTLYKNLKSKIKKILKKKQDNLYSEIEISKDEATSGVKKEIEFEFLEIDSEGNQNIFNKSFRVNIPAGVNSKSLIRLKGQGSSDGKSDLILKVFIR